MIKTGAAVSAILLAAAAPWAHADQAGLKNGKWEITYSTTETGRKIPPADAAKMTPAQRAAAEAKLKQEEGHPYTRTFTSCNRKAASEKAMLAVTLGTMHDEGNCARKALAHGESGVELEITCTAPHAGKAVFKYDTDEGKNATSTTDEQRTDGVSEHIEVSAHWVGACSSHS